jgi:hypothetical protein
MGRLVRIPRPAASRDAGSIDERDGADDRSPADAEVDRDGYLERVAKYVPAEVLAFSIFINAILDQAVTSGGKAATMAGLPVTAIATAALVAGTLLAPFFVWYVRRRGDAWITNAIVSCLAFPFWSYALGAVAFSDYRDGNLAAILLATFSVMSGLIKPPRPRRKEAAQAVEPATETKKEPAKEGPRLVLSTAMTVP